MSISALDEIKDQLENMANGEYEKAVNENPIDRPDEDHLFKDNADTASVVEDVLRWDEEIKKIKESGDTSYSSSDVFSSTRRKDRKKAAVEAEVVSSSSTPSWGYYGTRTTTTVTKTEDEKLRDEIEDEVDEYIDDSFDEVFDEEETFNVFALKEAEDARIKIKQSKVLTPQTYTERKSSAKSKVKVLKVMLKIMKTAINTVSYQSKKGR